MNHFERKTKRIPRCLCVRIDQTAACSRAQEWTALVSFKMATTSFAVVLEKCSHQDSFRGIYTSKGSATARDLVLELHPHGEIGKTFNVHCHGYDKGASGRKVSDKGFEIDITSEFSTPLAELKELGVRTCCFFHVGNKDFFFFGGFCLFWFYHII